MAATHAIDANVCGSRKILRVINIRGSGRWDKFLVDAEKEARMNSIKSAHTEISLHRVAAWCDEKGVAAFMRESGFNKKETEFHEAFHAKARETGACPENRNSAIEESAAQARESLVPFSGEKEKRRKILSMHRKRLAGINAMRMLHGMDTGNSTMEKDAAESLLGVCSHFRRGSRRAGAMVMASDFLAYLECLAIYGRFGLCEGDRMLLDAVHMSWARDADAARHFLLSRLQETERNGIEGCYGAGMAGFRLRPLHSERISYVDIDIS